MVLIGKWGPVGVRSLLSPLGQSAELPDVVGPQRLLYACRGARRDLTPGGPLAVT